MFHHLGSRTRQDLEALKQNTVKKRVKEEMRRNSDAWHVMWRMTVLGLRDGLREDDRWRVLGVRRLDHLNDVLIVNLLISCKIEVVPKVCVVVNDGIPSP